MINYCSTYDTLLIGNKLQNQLGDFSLSELYLFSYLACLISLYKGNPLSFWGYSFIKNELGVPLSIEITDSIKALVQNEEISQDGDFYKVTEAGQKKIVLLSSLSQFKQREPYIIVACDCLLALPLGKLKRAIYNEPILMSSKNNGVKMLLDSSNYAIDILYDQFSFLNDALGKRYNDLFVPAVTWLSYLQTFSNEKIR